MFQYHSPLTPHTGAPWTLEYRTVDADKVLLELRGDSGSFPIADLYVSSYSDEQEFDTEEERLEDLAEYEANAHLMAAAPELLQCTEHLRQVADDRLSMLEEEKQEALSCGLDEEEEFWLREDFDDQLDRYRLLNNNAKLAIAKARGKYPLPARKTSQVSKQQS